MENKGIFGERKEKADMLKEMKLVLLREFELQWF